MSKIKKLPILGLTSRIIVEFLNSEANSLNFETRQLIEVSKKYYKSTILIDPNKSSIELVMANKAKVYFDHQDISNLSTLIVRGTGNIELSVKVLVNALSALGCYIVDPLTRFSGERASKLLTTIFRHDLGVGSTSFIILGLDEVERVVNRIEKNKLFPILIKPIYGKHGIGIQKIDSKSEAIKKMMDYFQEGDESALLVQKWVNFINEYRCLVINGYCIGIAEKIKKENSLTGNANNCLNFLKVEDGKIEKFVLQNISSEGLLGVDVALSEKGEIHIIEANRAPEWEEFQDAIGFNVAEIIIKKIYEDTISYIGNLL